MEHVQSQFEVSGVTMPFEGNGRRLGYPTANITVANRMKEGVYFGYADLGPYSHHPALIFVGIPSTVGAKSYRVEAHLLAVADEDYYGMTMRLEICHFYRPNEQFASIDELVAAMHDDEAALRQWMTQHSEVRDK